MERLICPICSGDVKKSDFLSGMDHIVHENDDYIHAIRSGKDILVRTAKNLLEEPVESKVGLILELN